MSKKSSPGLLKKTVTDWLKVLVLLLDEAAVLVLVIVVISFFDIKIPLPVTITLLILVGIIVLILHRAVIPSFHWRKVTGSEGMIGAEGKVVKPLKPRGAIMVKGERWKAISTSGDIEVGADVEIIGIEGLTLTVKRKSTDKANQSAAQGQ